MPCLPPLSPWHESLPLLAAQISLPGVNLWLVKDGLHLKLGRPPPRATGPPARRPPSPPSRSPSRPGRSAPRGRRGQAYTPAGLYWGWVMKDRPGTRRPTPRSGRWSSAGRRRTWPLTVNWALKKQCAVGAEDPHSVLLMSEPPPPQLLMLVLTRACQGYAPGADT